MLRVEAATRVGALDLDVALAVAAGECLALAGPSGAGKTTILRVAAGLLRQAQGLVEADGETWRDTERSDDPGAWVDQAVHDVHDQVHDDEDDGEDDDRRLDDREIAPGHRLDHQAAEAGP